MTTAQVAEAQQEAPRSIESLNSDISIVINNGVVADLVVTGTALTYGELKEALILGQRLFEMELLNKALEDN